jgi:hypothetical protein
MKGFGGVLIFLVLLGGSQGPVRAAAPEPSRPQAGSPDTRPFDAGRLRDITGIEPTPSLPPAPRHWPLWLGMGLGGLALLGVVGWTVVRRGRRPSVPAPRLWALAELDRLEALDLPGQGEVGRYHALLAEVVRRYLDLRFQQQAPRQTTAEFLASLRRTALLSPGQLDLLQGLLERCDLAKFARVEFSVAECRAVGARARALVEETSVAPSAPA